LALAAAAFAPVAMGFALFWEAKAEPEAAVEEEGEHGPLSEAAVNAASAALQPGAASFPSDGETLLSRGAQKVNQCSESGDGHVEIPVVSHDS
jgi:hypothetical protein